MFFIYLFLVSHWGWSANQGWDKNKKIEFVQLSTQLAALSYLDRKLEPFDLNNLPESLEIEEDYYADEGASSEFRYFVVGNSQEVYVVFRGVGNRRALLRALYKQQVDFFGKGRVQKGIFDKYERMYVEVDEYIEENLNGRDIYLVGHSAGGVMCYYFTAQRAIEEKVIPEAACVLASPRPGNREFARFFQSISPEVFLSFRNAGDFVVDTPYVLLGYRHASEQFYSFDAPETQSHIKDESSVLENAIAEFFITVAAVYETIVSFIPGINNPILTRHIVGNEDSDGYIVLSNVEKLISSREEEKVLKRQEKGTTFVLSRSRSVKKS